jgi:MobA/VirD2-like, nuclease domain
VGRYRRTTEPGCREGDLDLEAHRRHTGRAIAAGCKPPKLVHNIVFSMPKGTPPEKVLRAVRVFAREKFALTHRYAMALHTDQGHPHVHMVVKAVSEQGSRLYIRPHTLREWRHDFAQYLRDLGVEANATERAVRGATRTTKRDGIHRAMLRGKSSHMRMRTEVIARELASGGLKPDPGQRVLLETRQAVLDGWRGLSDHLERDGNPQLAGAVRRFAEAMLPPMTEKETIARQIGAHLRDHRNRHEGRTL